MPTLCQLWGMRFTAQAKPAQQARLALQLKEAVKPSAEKSTPRQDVVSYAQIAAKSLGPILIKNALQQMTSILTKQNIHSD